MPLAALRVCAHPGCRELVERGRCAVHERRRLFDQQRGSSAERGYGAAWRRWRAAFLARNPLCEHHGFEGRTCPATVADHIVPHRGDHVLFNAADNLQALCEEAHDTKSARENGLLPCGHLMRVTVMHRLACAHCGKWLS